MKQIVADKKLVARCGLYCGACKRYLKDKCPGCAGNDKATWCKIRSCTATNGWSSCAECTLMPLESCKEFNSFMAKMFGLIFRSNRAGCIERIKEVGLDSFASEMAEKGIQSIPR